MEAIIMRPSYNGRMSKRAEVWLHRQQSAYDMVRYTTDTVLDSQYDTALDLLNRCTRYALAQTRHDEQETEQNQDQRWYIHRGELLDARRERLNNELSAYGCRLDCLGYFCNNVYHFDERGRIDSYGLLHFFD